MNVPCVNTDYFKPFWTDELNRLKSDSIFWHKIWLSADRPASGALYQLKVSANMKYKLGIRDAYNAFEQAHDDEIHRHWLSKNPQEFWKAWHSKFNKRVTGHVYFQGCTSDSDIADKFATFSVEFTLLL